MRHSNVADDIQKWIDQGSRPDEWKMAEWVAKLRNHASNEQSLHERNVSEGKSDDPISRLMDFYGVKSMTALVLVQEERIEHMRQQLPKLRGPESDPRNYRRG